MTIVFKSFEMLKNSRNLTDAQLKDVLANPCTASSSATYEDDLTEILLAWLSAASGIDWRRAYEHSDRGELQYCTLFLLSANPFGNSILFDELPAPDKLCSTIYQPMIYRFQLDVYKDNGAVESQQTASVNPAPVGSAFDVLNLLRIRTQHDVFSSALREYGIYAGRSGFITEVRNMPMELRHSTNEARATGMLDVVCNPQSSISSGTVAAIETAFCESLQE